MKLASIEQIAAITPHPNADRPKIAQAIMAQTPSSAIDGIRHD